MTHKDIYTKFMIEYDKAGASTSYPSLTEYEVATVLDKAYNALIAQKVTGNNVRRSTVESDIKSIADLGPLTKSEWERLDAAGDSMAPNISSCTTPANLLYFLQGSMKYTGPKEITGADTKQRQFPTEGLPYSPIDGQSVRGVPVKLVNHEIAQKFFSSASNIPWVKQPVCFIEDDKIYVVYDPLNPPSTSGDGTFRITYIRRPMPFVKELPANPSGYVSYFDYEVPSDSDWDGGDKEETGADTYQDRYNFECNSTVAEELISLAVAFALENVESQRLNSKLNMRGLEA